MTQAIPSDSSEVDLRVRDTYKSQSDPQGRLNFKIAQRVVDYLRPDSLLLVHPPGDRFIDSSLAPAHLEKSFTHLGVKVSTSSTAKLKTSKASNQIVLFVASDAQNFSKMEPVLKKVASSSATILFLTEGGESIESVNIAAAEVMARIAGVLFEAKFLKDAAFRVPFVGFFGTLYSVTDKQNLTADVKKSIVSSERDRIALALERDRIYSGKMSHLAASDKGAITDPVVDDLYASLLDRDRLIKKLRTELAETSQQVYVARDAVAGAEAEKASATAEASELHYHIHVKNKELEKLIEELDERQELLEENEKQEKLAEELAQTQTTNSLKQELKKYKVARSVAKVLAPVRRKIAGS